MNICLL